MSQIYSPSPLLRHLNANSAAVSAASSPLWQEMRPGIWVSPTEPSTGAVWVTNTTQGVGVLKTAYGNVSVPAASTITLTSSMSGNMVTMASTFIPPHTPAAPTFIPPVSGNTYVVTPLVPQSSDSLMPRDELIFADNPLTLTDDNKRAIRGFVMEIPSLARLVALAREQLEKLRAKRQAQREAKEQAIALAMSQPAATAQWSQLINNTYAGYEKMDEAKVLSEFEMLQRTCREHEAQMKALLLKEQAERDKRAHAGMMPEGWDKPDGLKWISMSRASRGFATA